ncbi:MAG: TetR/AcrR family transcriptional regulator [bacterium]|nr:TetR/AcrR family transcriptional regulator [bacterium]
MNKQESKYFNTAMLMDEALLYLLDKKDYDYITVKEICAKAGVNRSTFYLHYDSIDELLEETLDYVIKKFVSYFNVDTKDFINNIDKLDRKDLVLINNKYLVPYLNFVKENKKIFTVVFKKPGVMRAHEAYSSLEKYILNPILDKYGVPDYKKKYMLQFYVEGIMAIVKIWVINDCNDEIDTIIKIIEECVRA